MSCQKHYGRPVQCGCIALCSECRTLFPYGCSCAAKAKEKQEAKMNQIESEQRSRRRSMCDELLTRTHHDDPPTTLERVIITVQDPVLLERVSSLERTIKLMDIDHQLEMVKQEHDYNAEKMKILDDVERSLARIKMEPAMVAAAIKEERAITPPASPISQAVSPSESIPDLVQLPTTTELKKKEKKNTEKRRELEEKRASWERLTGKAKTLPKLPKGISRLKK